jgi:hypothetical protein
MKDFELTRRVCCIEQALGTHVAGPCDGGPDNLNNLCSAPGGKLAYELMLERCRLAALERKHLPLLHGDM